MNALQLQCWQSGLIPILNANQDLLAAPESLAAGSDLDLNTILSNLSEIKVILIVHSENSGAVMKGYFEISIDTESGGKFLTASTNETSVFFNTCEESLVNIVVKNVTNGDALIFLYS